MPSSHPWMLTRSLAKQATTSSASHQNHQTQNCKRSKTFIFFTYSSLTNFSVTRSSSSSYNKQPHKQLHKQPESSASESIKMVRRRRFKDGTRPPRARWKQTQLKHHIPRVGFELDHPQYRIQLIKFDAWDLKVLSNTIISPKFIGVRILTAYSPDRMQFAHTMAN